MFLKAFFFVLFATLNFLLGSGLVPHARNSSRKLRRNASRDGNKEIEVVTEMCVLRVWLNSLEVASCTWEFGAKTIECQDAAAGAFTLSLRDRAYLVRAVFCGRLSFVAHVALPYPGFTRRVFSCLFQV
uniref:Putative secreted protein n=1 Tax=Ixodes ricinus TaxID=34613 RepID=A0A6B0UQV3_IXORI